MVHLRGKHQTNEQKSHLLTVCQALLHFTSKDFAQNDFDITTRSKVHIVGSGWMKHPPRPRYFFFMGN